MDYRPLPEDRLEQYNEYTHYGFQLHRGPADDHDGDPPGTGDPRALFDGDEMLCVCKHHWLRARLRGQWIELPGVASVASPPEHRRKGYVTRLMAESLAEYRDRGDFLTALWPFGHPFYERHGWGLANKYVRYECAPGALSFAFEHESGEFRRVEADEYDLLEPALAAHAEGYELEVDRTETWWRERFFENWRGEPYVYAWEKDGEVRGYVGYRASMGDGGRELFVHEFAAADREAELNLLRFLANHDSQVEHLDIYYPNDTSLLDSVDDPEAVECKVEPGPLVRLVDVPAAFEAFDYPDAPDASFTVSVSDGLADWNDRTFRVSLADGRATCEPVGRPDANRDADVRTDVATLSQVVVGYHAVEDAELLGDLDVRSPDAREALSAMFPERDVFLRETF